MINLPSVKAPEDKIKDKAFPYNGRAVTEKSLSFSFSCFDRKDPLFNLGDKSASGVMPGSWFVSLLDCLKEVCNKTIDELHKPPYQLHHVNWKTANAKKPPNSQQHEYFQFRINKSRGRIIGFKIVNVFYVIWLDPHHNLTDSEGYGTATEYKPPLNEFDVLCSKYNELKDEHQVALDLLYEKCIGCSEHDRCKHRKKRNSSHR